MEMKYVVPDMAQSFGTLEFAGESDHVLTEIKITVEFSQEEATTFIQMCREGKMLSWKFPCRLAKRSSSMSRK